MPVTINGTTGISGVDGSASIPSYQGTDTNTGLRFGADIVSVVTGGSDRLYIDSTGQIEAGSLGSAAAPTFSFITDPNTGLYSPGADQVAISTNGTGRLFVDASGNVCLKKEPANPNFSKSLTVVATDAAIALRANSSGTYADQGIFFAVDGVNYSQIYNLSDGQLVFRTGSSLSERLRITSAGLVGVGTSSPSQPLQVVGAIASTAQASSLTAASAFIDYNTSFNGTRIGSVGNTTGSAGPIYFSQYSSNASIGRDAAVIDASGRVGIGTTSPGFPLDLISVSGEAVRLRGTSGTEVSKLLFTSNTAGADYGYLTSASGYLAFGYGASERARIDSGGRLLIGTSTDFKSTLLQVRGSATIGYAANDAFSEGLFFTKTRATSPGTQTVVQSGDSLGLAIFQGSDGSAYRTAAQIEAFVDGTPGANDMPGRLVFSTTADGASFPTERMRITSAGKTTIFAASGQNVLGVHTASAAGTTDYAFYVGSSATSTTAFSATNLGIFTNGNVVNTNNSYGAISDIKLKENIVDAGSQWSDLKALQVRKYNFKEGQTHTQIGLVAQEVELVSPGLVTESSDRDAEGNDLGTVTKSVNYSVLYMKAVKALQEAMERIEQLETTNASFEARLSALEVKP